MLRAHLPWSESDDAEVAAAASLSADDPYAAYFEVAWGALRRLVGDEAASQLPGVAALRRGTRDVDTYVAGVSWNATLVERTRPYIAALTDPELPGRFTDEAGAAS